MMQTFFAVLLVAALSPAPAAAEPVTALVTALSTFAAKSAIHAFIVRIGLSLALSALSVALRGKPKPGRPSGIKTEASTTGGTNPQTFIIGRYATSGNMMAPPYSATPGAVPNEMMTYVLDVSDMPGVTLERMAVAGEWVEDFAASSGDHDFEGHFKGTANAHVFYTWHDGTGTLAADAYMMANHAADTERPWASDMLGEGLTYAVVTFRYNREVFNQLPGVRFEVLGIPLYDPRADDTAGGTGSQRWADASTWAQTDNPVVMIYNILRGITLPDGRIWGGRAAAEDLPAGVWFAAMNECDETVTLPDASTVAQYRAGLEVSINEDPAAVIEQLLKACSGDLVEAGGTYKIRVGPPGLPVLFFTDDDVVSLIPETWDPFPGIEGVFNGIHASYPDPASIWEVREAPALYNATWEAQDGGRQLVADVPLPAVPYPYQVQQLMAAWIADERRFMRHNLALGPAAEILEPLDAISWTSADHGYSAKVFEVGEISTDPGTLVQSLAIRERDSSDYVYDPSADATVIEYPSTAIEPA